MERWTQITPRPKCKLYSKNILNKSLQHLKSIVPFKTVACSCQILRFWFLLHAAETHCGRWKDVGGKLLKLNEQIWTVNGLFNYYAYMFYALMMNDFMTLQVWIALYFQISSKRNDFCVEVKWLRPWVTCCLTEKRTLLPACARVSESFQQGLNSSEATWPYTWLTLAECKNDSKRLILHYCKIQIYIPIRNCQ